MRVRWIQVRVPYNMPTLAGHLRKLPFAQESVEGFTLERVREDSLEAKFIERHEVVQSVVSPFGEELSYGRTEFAETQFSISSRSGLMALTNPPRASSRFFATLSAICDHRLSIKEPAVDVLKWFSFIEQELQEPMKVQKIQLSKLTMREDVQASAILQSVNDVRSVTALLTQGKSCQIDKLKTSVHFGSKSEIILSRRGSALVNAVRSKLITEKIQMALIRTLTQH